MSFTPYDAGVIVGRGRTDLARAAHDAVASSGTPADSAAALLRGIRDGLHEQANRDEVLRRMTLSLETVAAAFRQAADTIAEAARWRTRYELTVSYEVGPQDRLRADTQREACNELADIVARAAGRGQVVAAWNIAPVRELIADDAEPAGIAHRNTSA